MRFDTTMLASKRHVALSVLLPFLVATLSLPVQLGRSQFGVAWAQEEKPALGIIPLARRGDVGVLAVARIEEYLRAMLEAGGSVRILPAKVIDSGRAPGGGATVQREKPVTAASKALDKADTLAMTSRTMLEEGENAEDALKLLNAAADRYEANFAELVDFTKLVDVYAMAAAASLQLSKEKEAKNWVQKALTVQPTFVVDARKSNKNLQSLVSSTLQNLSSQPKTALTVEASQPESEVFVDGVRIGLAPASVKDLLPGTHFVQVRRPGALPWGETALAKGKPLAIKANLAMEPDQQSEIELAVQPEDVKAFAQTGKFHEKVFRNTAFLFTKQVRAQFLLYGVVAKTARDLELHMFLFSAKQKRIVQLDKVTFALSLNDLQMKMLDAEGRVRAAVASWPADRELKDLPDAYGRQLDAAEAPEIVPTPPQELTTPEPEKPVTRPRVEPVRPRVEPIAPRVEPKRTLEDGSDPYAGLLQDEEPAHKAVYKTWWFWTAVGVVAACVAAGVYFGTRSTPQADGFRASAVMP